MWTPGHSTLLRTVDIFGYAPTGTYHDFVEQVVAKYKTLEPLDALAALISPENIRKNLQDENDIYKFEYCSIDANSALTSFVPFHSSGMKEAIL